MKITLAPNFIISVFVCTLATTNVFAEETIGSIIPNMPERNPWLIDSVYPTSHFNSAQTDSVTMAGPIKGRKLTAADVKIVPTVFTSNPTIKHVGDETILFASGVNGIHKIIATGESLREVSFMPYPGSEAQAARVTPEAIGVAIAAADAARRSMNEARILAVSKKIEELGYKTMIHGYYNFFDKDGFHYALFGDASIIKTTDDNDPKKPILPLKVKNLAEGLSPEITKSIGRVFGAGMTYDGNIAVVASGALFLVDRDLNVKDTLALPGESICNSIAVDKTGIYVVTSKRMLKVVYTGTKLSYDDADGGWQSEYNTVSDKEAWAAGSFSRGSGTTPTLMGFGDAPDKLVIIADADKNGTNLVAFWRDQIPEGFKQKSGTKSARIADQIRIDISKVTIEVSAGVLGYGVSVNNATYPNPVRELYGRFMTAGVTRPGPMGVQKFTWNPKTHSFEKAWVNMEVDNTDLLVPVISAKTNMIYVATKVNGDYQFLGLDWSTGKVKARWVFPDDSRVWNTICGIAIILDDGDFLLGGYFSIKRVNVGN